MSLITRKYPEVDPKVDTTYYLWDVYFLITINQLETVTKDYIREIGFVDGGDPLVNKEIANEMIVTKANIAAMVDYHRRGVSFYIKDKEDTAIIYEYVQNHLEKFASTLMNRSLNKTTVPIDDLLAMEEFADKVYGHAKYLKTGIDTRGNFRRSMMLDDSIFEDPRSILETRTPEQIKEEQSEQDRQSFVEVFKNRQNEVDRLWK